MKKLIICFVSLMSQVALAETHKIAVPAMLKGATVTVTLKNGEKHNYSSEEWAVVPREQERDDAKVIVALPQKDENPRPNSVKVYGGVGPHGLKVTNGGSGITVEQDYGLTYGVGYGRKLSKKISLDGVLLMNPDGAQGGLLGVGYNW